MEENKNSVNESNAAKRLRLLGENMDEKIHSEEDEIKKGNFWENLWYQHKWVIIIAIFFLITIVWLTITITTSEKKDIKIMYAGPEYLNSIKEGEKNTGIEQIKNALSGSVVKDYNGDGKVIISLDNHTILNSVQLVTPDKDGKKPTPQQIGNNEATLNTFIQQIRQGEIMLFLIDEGLYKENFDDGMFRSVDDALKEATGDENAIVPSEWKCGEYAVYLKKTELGSYVKGLDKLPDDTVLCISPKYWGTADHVYEYSLEFFKDVILYEAPNE
jgi:hypothetical protein